MNQTYMYLHRYLLSYIVVVHDHINIPTIEKMDHSTLSIKGFLNVRTIFCNESNPRSHGVKYIKNEIQ